MLLLERIIVESIKKEGSFITDITVDTKLDHSLVLILLTRLQKKGLIQKNHGRYSIVSSNSSWQREHEDSQLCGELQELTEKMVTNYFHTKKKETLKLQKVYMTKSEEKIFDSLLDSLESFIKGLQKEQAGKILKDTLSEKKVIFWAYTDYKNLIGQTLRSVS